MKKFFSRLKKDGVFTWMLGALLVAVLASLILVIFGPLALNEKGKELLYRNDHGGLAEWVFIFVVSLVAPLITGIVVAALKWLVRKFGPPSRDDDVGHQPFNQNN